MQKLPIGISSFRQLRENDYLYVDKTSYVQQLVDNGRFYFLSRPRRFGKSLLVDTFKELFLGNKQLFNNLAIYDEWDWSQTHPVIHLSFTDPIIHDSNHLDTIVRKMLLQNQARLGVASLDEDQDNASLFADLITATYTLYDQEVVILIDEYDKPILDNITSQDRASSIHHKLRSLYSVVKGRSELLRFAFLTGVSKFSKVSIFSGLNNLKDITLDSSYGSICGYTQTELENSFSQHLAQTNAEEIKRWYNGYNWTGDKVYNPFDILLFISEGCAFSPYWFETGTPHFLLELVRKANYYPPQLESVEATILKLGDFDVDHIRLETVLFQTGYLTIKDVDTSLGEPIFTLGFPNLEVQSSFNKLLLDRYLTDGAPASLPLIKALQQADTDTIRHQLTALFESLSHENYRRNSIADYEGYYASVVYSYFSSLGVELIAEDTTSRGRIDLTIKVPRPDGSKTIYIIEFKVIRNSSSTGKALQQVLSKNYAAKYVEASDAKTVVLLGIEFDASSHSLATFESHKL